ncbi:sugar ABC transporter [Sorangium cellulosum]|uniref:Sugar ABC transporter n=1 Tax=Sorangium cellulosum TaxID=56 RepID=A0A4P2Q585_SORCE|nr:substrate-binding domain-containing protein [Sorangium cellulosum]AUX24555.1 sugar ABC transporter [Sorangium cellulosum]
MTRNARWGMTALALTLSTAACGSGDASDEGSKPAPIRRISTSSNEFTPMELEVTIDRLVTELNRRPSRPMQMAILLKEASGFWSPVVKAATRAMGELGVLGSVIGPIAEGADDEERVELQNRQIEQVVADGAEGLGLAPFNNVQTAAVDDAIARGVHVVTLDTDVPTTRRSLHVGTLDIAAGRTAGETLLAMLPPAPGTVILHGSEDTEWVNGMERTLSAREVLEAAGYEVLVRQATWTSTGEAEDVEWMQARLGSADPPVVGMLGLFNISYRCAMAAEAASKLDIPIVAFDFDPKTVDYMRQGRIQATHIQRQYYQGYLVPYILYGINSIGLEATKQILIPLLVDGSRVNTGVDVVPADKIDAYNDFLGSIDANQ